MKLGCFCSVWWKTYKNFSDKGFISRETRVHLKSLYASITNVNNLWQGRVWNFILECWPFFFFFKNNCRFCVFMKEPAFIYPTVLPLRASVFAVEQLGGHIKQRLYSVAPTCEGKQGVLELQSYALNYKKTLWSRNSKVDIFGSVTNKNLYNIYIFFVIK